jgi:hypothetical protein
MKPTPILLTALLVLSACATVTSETSTQARLEGGFYDGEPYEIRTQVLEGPNGTFERTSVVYRGLARTCIKDSPNDCTYAARDLITYYDEAIFGAGRF